MQPLRHAAAAVKLCNGTFPGRADMGEPDEYVQIPMKPAGYSDLKAATVPN